jgi:hypothetical protein
VATIRRSHDPDFAWGPGQYVLRLIESTAWVGALATLTGVLLILLGFHQRRRAGRTGSNA